ncbi:MAG: peroxidase-related enzyme [Ignavibacteriaceae bacterium]
MTFIKVINETEAEGKLKEVYSNIISSRGKLSNIMKIHSLNPDAMVKHMELYKSIMFGKSNISREVKEMIAIVVSVVNKCEYCIRHHAEALNYYWKDTEKLQKFIKDYKSIKLSPEINVLLNYAYNLTAFPNAISQKTIDDLKTFNWNDEDILLVNLIISYFNFVNRIALGLGVESSEDEVKGYKY